MLISPLDAYKISTSIWTEFKICLSSLGSLVGTSGFEREPTPLLPGVTVGGIPGRAVLPLIRVCSLYVLRTVTSSCSTSIEPPTKNPSLIFSTHSVHSRGKLVVSLLLPSNKSAVSFSPKRTLIADSSLVWYAIHCRLVLVLGACGVWCGAETDHIQSEWRYETHEQTQTQTERRTRSSTSSSTIKPLALNMRLCTTIWRSRRNSTIEVL